MRRPRRGVRRARWRLDGRQGPSNRPGALRTWCTHSADPTAVIMPTRLVDIKYRRDQLTHVSNSIMRMLEYLWGDDD